MVSPGRKGDSPVSAFPVDSIEYTANNVLGLGAQLATANYVVYSDTGSNFTLSGLNPATTYYISLFS